MLEKLSSQERALLARIQLRADTPLTEHARALRMRVHTVRTMLNRLETKYGLTKRFIADVSRIGLCSYHIAFTSSVSQRSKRQKFLKTLQNSKHVSWMQELGAEYRTLLCILAEDHFELIDILDSFANTFGEVFIDKAIATVTEARFFGRKFPSKKSETPNEIVYIDAGRRTVEIDDLDRRLITFLSEQPTASRRDAAQALGAPVTTVDYRMNTLKSSGVIKGTVYSLPYLVPGRQQFRALLTCGGVSHERSLEVIDFARKDLRVLSCSRLLGAWDFELRVETSSNRELGQFLEDLRDKFGSFLSSVQALPVVHVLKPVTYGLTL